LQFCALLFLTDICLVVYFYCMPTGTYKRVSCVTAVCCVYGRWRTWPITECSTHCGRGKQTMGFQCVQQFHDSNIGDKTVHNSSCAHVHKPAEVVDCEGPCNSTHWEFGIWSQVWAVLFIYWLNVPIFWEHAKHIFFPDIYSVF